MKQELSLPYQLMSMYTYKPIITLHNTKYLSLISIHVMPYRNNTFAVDMCDRK